MTIKNFKKLTALGVVVFGSAIFAQAALSAPVDIDSGDSVEVATSTDVNAVLVVATQPLQFGTFGTKHDVANAKTATGTLDPDSTFHEDLVGTGAGEAKVIDANLTDHAAATVSVTGFKDTTIFVDYSDIQDMVGQTTPAEVLTVSSLLDNLNSPDTGTGAVAGGWTSGGGFVQGYAQTDSGTGVLLFSIGGSFTTVAATTYSSQDYHGSFDVTLSY